MHKLALFAVGCSLSTVATAQEAAPTIARPALGTVVDGAAALPANTEIMVSLNREINSKRARVGQTFDVSVSRDVVVAGQTVIPRGTHGIAAVTWRTGKGAFGKSGKMEIEVRSLDYAGRSIPMSGKFRQEGEGNTGATVGTIVAAGVIAGAFVTGHSAVFEQGRELRAFTAETVPMSFAARSMPVRTATVFARQIPAPVQRETVAALAAPVSVGPAYYAETAEQTPAQTLHRRLLAAQGVRGREVRQGWTISD